MDIKFEIKNGRIFTLWDNASADVDLSKVSIGHLGCKLLGTLPDIPQNLVSKWNQEFGSQTKWKNKKDSKRKLAISLHKAMEISHTQGAVLWDTMRSGSDFWRPGKLLLDSIEILPSEYQNKVSYSREDFFCPPRELLNEFKHDANMSFGEYAARYSEFLNTGKIISVAMASVLFDLSRNKLPIFYCVDPYIPHFAKRKECCSNIPYDKRQWLDELRTEGCHRVVLVEEIVKAFFRHGIDVKIIELDPTFEESYARHYSSKGKNT